MFEIHDRGPVVGFILFEPAGSATCSIWEVFVGIHGQIETTVSSDVNMNLFIETLTHSSRGRW